MNLRSAKPFDFLLIILILFLGLFLCLHGVGKKGGLVAVNADGRQYEYSAEKNGIYEVQGVLGKTVFEIKDGKVRIIDSPCQNKICVNQGWHTPLVCLPNNVIITLQNASDMTGQGEYDAVSE